MSEWVKGMDGWGKRVGWVAGRVRVRQGAG